MTQTTTEQNNPDHPRLETGEESENFSKVVKTESGHLAIVDASVLHNLQHPMAADAVIFPTKQTPGEEVSFLVKGEYDDTILRNLQMRPAELEEVQHHEQRKSDKEAVKNSREKMREDVQIRGHDRRGGLGNTVAKKLSKIDRKSSKPVQQKKKRQSTKEPKDVKTDVKDHIKGQMAQRVSIKGAQRDNYGQPQSKHETQKESIQATELLNFLNHVKNNSVTTQLLDGMEFTYQINEGLKQLRSEIAKGETQGNLDLVCESVSILDDYHRRLIPQDMKLIEGLLRRGVPFV